MRRSIHSVALAALIALSLGANAKAHAQDGTAAAKPLDDQAPPTAPETSARLPHLRVETLVGPAGIAFGTFDGHRGAQGGAGRCRQATDPVRHCPDRVLQFVTRRYTASVQGQS
ncbi:MAG: hypothetical protein QM765_28675 [Myxococcales bacterium]